MNIIVTGATGLAGAEVLRQAILHPEINTITAISRRLPDIKHSKIKTIIHQDFLDYTEFDEVFRRHDAMLWCLGISQSQVSKEQYEMITYEFVVRAAAAIRKTNPDMKFIFLSGMGADQTEKSRTLFARIKGKTENELIRMGLKHLYIVRPGGIRPVHRNPNTALSNKLMIPFFPLLQWLMPSAVISSTLLAQAMLQIAMKGSANQVMDNVALQKLGAEYGK